jgi:glycosyltransferase involved in cell wall biosynthesis
MDTRTNLSIIIPNHNEKEIEWVYSYCRYFFPYSEIIVENDYTGRGKGYTVREGFKKSTKDWIIFLDGDMDIHPREIKKLLERPEYVTIGTKEINSYSIRGQISKLSRYIIRYLFRLPCSDTQTGLKLFNRKSLSDWKTSGFLFDVEIIYKAYKKNFKIKEVPIISGKPSKRKGLFVLIKSLWELIILWFRLLFR